MKKSKIIGLSLGFTALAAVAISTPFIVTSCSSSSESNEIKATLKTNFITGKIGNSLDTALSTDLVPGNIKANGQNSIEVYTGGNNQFVSLSLSNVVNDIINATDIENLGIEGVTPTFAWNNLESAQNGFTFASGTLANDAQNGITNEQSKTITVTGAFTWKKAATDSEAEQTVTKTLSVQITIFNKAAPATK